MTFSSPTEPVCAKHTDRITYVVCQRCGAGICPQCMIPAPVGFQCPNCVAQARGHIRSLAPSNPQLTLAIVALCSGLQVLNTLSIGTSTGFLKEFGLVPVIIAVKGEYFRLLSSVFIHAGVFHIAMNMLMLWILGRTLEPLLGRLRFGALFVLSGLGGAMASYWLNDPMTAAVGASGAIFGLLGALFVLGRERGTNTQEITGIIGINLVLGFVIPGVDWHAHLGGLVVGAIAGWALIPSRNKAIQVLVPLALVAGLIALGDMRTAQILSTLQA